MTYATIGNKTDLCKDAAIINNSVFIKKEGHIKAHITIAQAAPFLIPLKPNPKNEKAPTSSTKAKHD